MSVINVTELTFVPDIDIWDRKTPAGKIWQSTLRYVQLCPGYQGAFVSKTLQNHNKLKLLTFWADHESYRQFQLSMGVSLLVGFLECGIQQCRLDCSQVTVKKDDLALCVVLGCFSELKSTEQRLSYKQAVLEEMSSFGAGASIICSQSDWLETSARSKFVGIFESRQLIEPESTEEFVNLLEKHAEAQPTAEFPESANFLRVADGGWTYVPSPQSLVPGADPVIHPTCMSSLLTIECAVKFTSLPQRGSTGSKRDLGWDPRINDRFEPGQPGWRTGYPAPTGGYTPMQALEQKPNSPVPGKRLVHRTYLPDPKSSVDIVQLVFKPDVLNKLRDNRDVWWWPDTEVSEEGTQVEGEVGSEEEEEDEINFDEFRVDHRFTSIECEEYNRRFRPDFVPAKVAFIWSAMRRKLLNIKGCKKLVYGICEEHDDTVNLMIKWNENSSREGFNHGAFEDLSPYLLHPPSLKHFPSLAISMDFETRRAEMIKFYVPATFNNKKAFEHYYFDFVDSLNVDNPVSGGHHISEVGYSMQGGWQQEKEVRKGEEVYVYFTLIFWNSKKAEEGWYLDFKEGMLKSYERLGHRHDGLRAMLGDVESFHSFLRFHDASHEEPIRRLGEWLF